MFKPNQTEYNKYMCHSEVGSLEGHIYGYLTPTPRRTEAVSVKPPALKQGLSPTLEHIFDKE